MTGNDVRKIFIEYFKKHNHRHVRSSSLVPENDPTLLFVNSGMVQFKRMFTGDEKRDYSTAVTSQKCVRAGGKHNDLENVGYTSRHHTFFEMLGNFSFGDYFKENAIEFGWDLLTNGYGFSRDKLWISVYREDKEAFDIWKNHIGIPERKIVKLGKKDNFWTMGNTGPCGPCSEIHIDRGEEFGCSSRNCMVGCDCDRWLELWNLVFMQFERDEQGNMTLLPKPSIDTGMGLERVTSVLQDVPTNFDTDLFVPIMKKVGELAGRKREESDRVEVAMKVIADHSRAAAFLICDGILPSNEGRGYVLRRIMRRAIRYGRSIGLVKPFLHETVKTVFEIMDEAYPEIRNSSAFILKTVKNEEKIFLRTLDTGMKLLENTIDDIRGKNISILPGDIIFKLYDTFGFPVDIIKDHLKEKDISLDIEGFNRALTEQKTRSRSAKKFQPFNRAYKALASEGTKTPFQGYEKLETDSEILIIVKNNEKISQAEKGDKIELITSSTVFYPESGGQTGDSGIFRNNDCVININNTISHPPGIIIHQGEVASGRFKEGDTFSLRVDPSKRQSTSLNHTATHILHYALRKILGDHVKQSGSLVTDKRLRFDFVHFSPVSPEELKAVENEVNLCIRENHSVLTREMNVEEAVKSGATALFGEKYNDVVRVVSQGNFSKELCGGTHTKNSGDIGIFRILSETGIASGVRRIEAVTGQNAMNAIHKDRAIIEEAANLLKSSRDSIVQKLETFLKDRKKLEKEVLSLKARIASGSVKDIDDDIKKINGIKIISKRVDAETPSGLRDLADKFKAKIGSGIVLLGAESNGKAFLISMVTKDLTKQYKAGDIVKKAAKIIGGSGGGRPDMAQAGGLEYEKLDRAIESVYQTVL